jgi:hypothetical protein
MRIRQAHNLPIPAYLTAGAAEQAAGETLDIEGE